MSNPPPFFDHMIKQCRASHGSFGSRLLLAVSLFMPIREEDDATRALKLGYRQLLGKGRVVWGAISQANSLIFEPGDSNVPGVTVYSTDPYYDANPQDLRAIGSACFELKNTHPEDPGLAMVAARLTEEYDHTPRIEVPMSLTDGRRVWMGATMFTRDSLPGGVLRAGVFPLVVDPDSSELNLLLPLSYWAPQLRDQWDALNTMLAALPVTSTAMRVAQRAKKFQVTLSEPDWDTQAIPVMITPAVVDWVRAEAAKRDDGARPMLMAWLGPDGEKQTQLITEYDPQTHVGFESTDGVAVVVLRSQLEQMRGVWINYQATPFGSWLLMRLPGE